MRMTLVAFVLALAACGTGSGACQLPTSAQGATCPAGVTINSSTAGCLDSKGDAYICRNGSGYCVVCEGPTFTDGCALGGGGGEESYCVHDCDHC